MSVGTVDEINDYFNRNYRGHFEKFCLYNIRQDFYWGTETEVYAVHNEKISSVLSPVIHILKVVPENMKWYNNWLL